MRFTTRQRRMPAVMIINLVDILAILVIFLVVTTTFKKDQPEVVINLPESKTAVTQPGSASEASVVLYVAPDKTVWLDEKKAGDGGKIQSIRRPFVCDAGGRARGFRCRDQSARRFQNRGREKSAGIHQGAGCG